MVLKEADGKFEPRVKENLFRPTNVVKASKSGKMTSGINFFFITILHLI